MEWNGMERKFRYGIWNMPEWNRMEDFKNGMEDNLLYFHTNSMLINFVPCIYKKICGCRVVINNIDTEVFNVNIYSYFFLTNRGTLVMQIAQTVYVLHHSKYIAICSIDVIISDFDRFDFFFF